MIPAKSVSLMNLTFTPSFAPIAVAEVVVDALDLGRALFVELDRRVLDVGADVDLLARLDSAGSFEEKIALTFVGVVVLAGRRLVAAAAGALPNTRAADDAER